MPLKPEPDEHQYHEIMDRLHVIMCMIDDHLLQHPVAKLNKEVCVKIEEAAILLGDAYQKAGLAMFKENE